MNQAEIQEQHSSSRVAGTASPLSIEKQFDSGGEYDRYKVQAGDSLTRIAYKFGMRYEPLIPQHFPSQTHKRHKRGCLSRASFESPVTSSCFGGEFA